MGAEDEGGLGGGAASPWVCLAALLLGGGCATLSGRSQRVAVDSAPRGATLRGADGAILGVTPTVIQVRRARALSFSLELGAVRRPLKMRCGVRWWIAALGNAPFGVVTAAQLGWGMAAAVGVDLWTGAAWECAGAASVALPGASAPPSCRRLLVLPLPHEDYAEQDALARAWAARASGCDEVLLPEDHRLDLARLGVAEADTAAHAGRPTLVRLAEATGATHVVRLGYAGVPQRPGRVRLTGEVEDLYTGEVTPAASLTVPRPSPAARLSLRGLFRYIHLLPNSVAYAPSALVLKVEPGGGYGSGRVEQHASLPTVLTGWTLTSAQHPAGFGPWHAAWRGGPGFGVGVLDATWRASGEGRAPFEARSRTAFLRGWYELGGLLHTPLGAFGLHLIAGAALVHQGRLGGDAPRSFSRGELGVGAAYTAFLSERVFLRLATSVFGADTAFVRHRSFEVHQFVQNTLVVGYYLPETRAWVRGLFD